MGCVEIVKHSEVFIVCNNLLKTCIWTRYITRLKPAFEQNAEKAVPVPLELLIRFQMHNVIIITRVNKKKSHYRNNVFLPVHFVFVTV